MPASPATARVDAKASAKRPRPLRRSARLLAELLAMNEEMILQLGVERREGTGTTAFLTRMIEQHERAAALLRRELQARRP
jgi:hypothetical protein